MCAAWKLNFFGFCPRVVLAPSLCLECSMEYKTSMGAQIVEWSIPMLLPS